jgi:perosamine synthetase
MSFFRPIHHTFAPLGNARQCRTALGLLLRPWRWKKGSERETLRDAFATMFGGDAFLFGSGREALLASLRSLTLTPGEEVIVQGYTCIVVPNAIIAAGCVPVFVDIDRDTLNLNVEDVEKAITPKTRAVICQHTFGIPSDTAGLRALCDKHSLMLIEDCAHVIPDKDTGDIGLHGDVLFFSFGRDKAISGVTGGAVVSRDDHITEGLAHEEALAKHLPAGIIGTLLLYPLLYALCRPLYASGLGKALLAACGKIGVLRPIVTKGEKDGVMRPALTHLPNACAALALQQLRQLHGFNDHRRALMAYYLRAGLERGWFRPNPLTGESPLPLAVDQDLPLQKFPLFALNADHIRHALKQRNIHLNDGWTNCVVCPSNAAPAKAGYVPGSDPKAEAVCEKILSLPTHPGTSLKDAAKLVEALDGFLPKKDAQTA